MRGEQANNPSHPQQHAPSVAIFANYLILDTLLSTIPRFLLLLTITSFSSSICSPSNTLQPIFSTSSDHLPSLSNTSPSTSTSSFNPLYALAPMRSPHSEYLSQSDFTPESCMRTVYLGQLMLGAGVVVATVLQLVGAMCVRGYARVLWVREMREEEMLLGMAEEREREREGYRDEGRGAGKV
ncbi:hypothetical protein DL98DRAFT_11957 [Cadophora sp. DSE1049]|nr:hypothetical protein DL98DRAFT_11957 [Cadophora sp. DSE1049]